MQQPSRNNKSIKGASSRYDYVKVRVWLGSKYYYVLSRFSVSQILMLCRVPQKEAQKIALRLKKHLVDQGILDIEQERLNQTLFQVAQGFGVSETTFQLYAKVLKYYQLKLPCIIVLYGVDQVTMMEIAGRIAERLNIYNVLDTDTVYHIWHLMTTVQETSTDALDCTVCSHPMEKQWMHVNDQKDSWLNALEGNVYKSIREGKSLILYGVLLQPNPITVMLKKYSGTKPYFLQYCIESELLEQLESSTTILELSRQHNSSKLLLDIQREHKKQAEMNDIPCFRIDSTKQSIVQIVESVHEDYLRLLVSLSEEEKE